MKNSVFRKSLVLGLMVLMMSPMTMIGQPRYKVSACDWMMLKRQKPGAISLAHEIGADGVEIDMGPLGQRVRFESVLDNPADQQKFLSALEREQVECSSIAMSGFFAQNLLKRDNYLDLVQQAIDATKLFGCKVIFLPLGGSGHEWEDPSTPERKLIVERLHNIGELAKKQGKVVAIRPQLDVDATKQLLKQVKSKGLLVYYNLQDAVDNHRDPAKEILQLGRKRIAQVHASLTDSVTLDRDPRIDMPSVKKALDKIGYKGWLVVERSRNAKDVRNVRGNYSANVKFLKEIFREEK